MAHSLQINSSDIAAQHQAAIAASLARRMAVAQAAQNTELIALLQQEQRQLESKPSFSVLLNSLKQVSMAGLTWLKAIANRPSLSVEQIVDDSGALYWHAHDAHTGKTLYAESPSDVLKWIEDNRLGR